MLLRSDGMNIKLLRKGDFAVIAAVIVVAAALLIWRFASSPEKLEAVITVDGEIVETVDLSAVAQRTVIETDTSPETVIVAENGAIYFESAECSDKLCVACGKLTHKGDTAVCLPARTVITVGEAEVDAVTY